MATEDARWRTVAVTIETNCPIVPWSGDVWRCPGRRYAGDGPPGSLKVSGRYHCGHDKCSGDAVWPALYTSLAEHVALGERLRHTTPENLRNLANQRLSRLSELGEEDLCHPAGYRWTHYGHLARAQSEAMLIPSGARFPEGNLIIFPDRLQQGASIAVVDSIDPSLYVDWAQFT